MAKRGRIIRDPTAGAGLVIVQGRQHSFGLESVWKSDTLPRPGAVVDVEFDEAGHLVAMKAVPEARLAMEQAEAAIAQATTKGAGLIARLGLPHLAAFAALLVGWFWLTAINADGPIPGRSQSTLWEALGALGAVGSTGLPTAGTSLYNITALLCLAGPLLICAWHDRRAHIAALLPLAFMLAVAVPILVAARDASVPSPAAVSLGVGAYVALLAALYLALAGIKRFLVATARDATVFYENE